MAKILVLAEHDDGQLKLATLSAMGFAHKVCAEAGGDYDVLILGENISTAAESLRSYGAVAVLVADQAALKAPLADKYAYVIDEVARAQNATMVVGAASTFSKDVLPRAAALLDAGMISDVIEVRPDGGDFIFKRVMFAGNVIATVKLDGALKFLTVRSAAFAPPPKSANASPITPVAVDPTKLPSQIEYV